MKRDGFPKRSKKAALCLMVPAAALMLSACGEEREQAMVFESINDCASSTLVSPEQCRSDYAEAAALHPQVAPKYVDKASCETDFGVGQCESAVPATEGQPQQASAGGMFMPMMMGFLAGRMMSGLQQGQPQAGAAPAGAQPNAQAAGGKTNVATQPLYKSRDDRGTFRTATNKPVAGGIGPITLKPSQVKPQAGQLVPRGGFGSQAAMRAANTAGG